MAARSSTTPPSAHSIRQSPVAMSGLGQDHQPALEAALLGHAARSSRARPRRAASLMRTTRCGVATRCEKQSLTSAMISPSGSRGDQFAAQLARHRDRDVDRLGLHPGLDAGEARGDALDGDADLLQRQRGAAVAFRLGLALGRPRSRRDRRAPRRRRSSARSRPAVAARSRVLSGAAKSMSNRNFAGAAISTPARRRRGSWSA